MRRRGNRGQTAGSRPGRDGSPLVVCMTNACCRGLRPLLPIVRKHRQLSVALPTQPPDVRRPRIRNIFDPIYLAARPPPGSVKKFV